MASTALPQGYARRGPQDEAPAEGVPANRPDAFSVNEPRAPIPNDMVQYIGYWWDTTAETPEFRDYRRQVAADDHDLFPFDERRARRNEQEGDRCGMRSKEDSRLVQNPHLFRASQRAVAMTIPDDHTFEFQGRDQVPSESRQEAPMGHESHHVQFAATVTCVERQMLEEIGVQSILEDWVRDATFYRAGILKAWWQHDYRTDPLSQNRLQDMQDELGELQSYMADFARGRFDKNDGRYRRMIEMHQAIMDETQLRVWQGVCAETVDLDRFRVDGAVRSFDSFYSAKWMSEDLVMTKRGILGRFTYEKDDDDPKGFTGVHPDDLNRSNQTDNSGNRVVEKEDDRRKVDRGTRNSHLSTEASAYDSQDDDEELFLVRQVWIKDEGKVMILIEGLDYAADEWIPQNTPAQWYPYFPLVLNRQHGHWFGRSDTELASDEQARINQKQTDGEKMRELAKPRGIYNKGALDEQEAIKLSDVHGGEIRGISMQGDKLRDNFEWLTFPYDPMMEDTSGNQQMLDKMVGFPEAFLGNASANVQFATQAQLAAAGTNIMVRARQALVRRALAGFYTTIAEILIQVLDQEQVKLIAGPRAYWPRLYGKDESMALKAEMMAQVKDQIEQEMIQIANDPEPELKAMEFPGIEQPVIRAQTLYEGMAMEQWGQLEPLTRESLFKRLKIKVKTDPDGIMAKQTKFQNLATMSDFLSNLGVRIAPRAAGQILAETLGMEDEVDDLVKIDPNVAVADVMQAFQENPNEIDPETMRLLAALGVAAQEQLKQQAAMEGAQAAESIAGEAERAVAAGTDAEAGGGGPPPMQAVPGEGTAGTLPTPDTGEPGTLPAGQA